MFGWLRGLIADFLGWLSVGLGGYLYGVSRTSKKVIQNNLKSVNEALMDKRKTRDRVKEMTDEELNEFID